MTSWKRLLSTGGSVFLLGLFTLLPARVIHHWVSPDALQLAGIEGTVWNGAANEAFIDGMYLQNLRWSMRPFALFTGSLAYALQAEPVGGFLDATVAVSLGGTVRVSALNAALPLQALQNVVRVDGISGDISLQMAEIRLADGWPTHAAGQAGLSNLVLRALAPAPLGNFQVEFQNTDTGVLGSVQDVSGMLKVAATLQLNPDRSYTLLGQVGPTATATPAIVEQLRFLGSPDARGLREFRTEGSL